MVTAGSAAVSGLDRYHETTHLGRFSYAVDRPLEVLHDVLTGWDV